MKLTFQKHIFGPFTSVVPRVELTDEEKAAGKEHVQVALSRTGTSCIYPLMNVEAHDDHAPRWNADGTVPVGRSAPTATIQSYMDGIVAQLKAAGLEVEATVEEIQHKFFLDVEDGPAPDASGKPEGEGWKKYGVN